MLSIRAKKQENKTAQLKNIRARRGFLLIEALTLLFIFSLIMVTFYSVFTVGTRYIQDAKNRLGALAIANEKIEIIRNLSYDDIGTVGGTIEGEILQDQTVIENTRQYQVNTRVSYQDDPFDGLGLSDVTWLEDYKKVTVTVSWGGGGDTEKVQLVARFVPPGKEVARIGDGILSVNIFSDQPGGAGIAGAKVQIDNSEVGINTYDFTDSSGNVTFMGDNIDNSIQKYKLTITKSDYETVETMPPYPGSPFEPVDVHASVVTGSMNVKNIVQNELADIRIRTVDYLGEPIGSIDFHLVGGRKLGTDSTIIPSVAYYNFDEDGATDSSGIKLFSSVSPGGYDFSLIDSAFNEYEIINIDKENPFFLMSADETLDVTVKLASKTATALLLTVVDEVNEAPIAGAIVRLVNATLGYEKELETASDGKVFFPDPIDFPDLFLPETYQVEIQAEGFSNLSSSVTINANELKLEERRLTSLE